MTKQRIRPSTRFIYSGVVSMTTRVPIAAVALLRIVVASPAIAESRDSAPSIPVEVQTLKPRLYLSRSSSGSS